MRSLSIIFIAFLSAGYQAQVNAYYTSSHFYSPGKGPYIETSMTVVGKSLRARQVPGGFQNSVNVSMLILKDSTIVKALKYNLLGPVFTTSTSSPVFLDNQRISLANGKYTLKITLADNYETTARPLVIHDDVRLQFDDNALQASSIQAIESYSRSAVAGPLTKSGYDLVPYNVNYYPETSRQLGFYFEAYNLEATLGKSQPFIYSWFIESAETGTRLDSYSSFKKHQAGPVNPLLVRMDIGGLGSGNYNLVIELRDSENRERLKQKYYFQRLNRQLDIVALQKYDERKGIAEYFGSCNNVDTLRMFVECLWPIAGDLDKERIINQSLKKDPDLMKRFVIDFWQRRAADTANPLKQWAAYYQQVQQVMVLFKCGKQKGYYSERGRVFLQYGAPNQRSQQANEPNTFPYEIWQYYRITDGVNGQFYSNRKFVFVNKQLGDDCYNLVHSDMRGEIFNPRWAYEVTRRNSEGLANPDQNTPGGTSLNQFNEIYSNPR